MLCLATPDGTLEVKWLRKAELSKSAFTPGDYVQTSTGHVALLMDLFQVNGTIIFQLCLLAQGPHSRDDLKLTWALLEAATRAPLDQCSFASMHGGVVIATTASNVNRKGAKRGALYVMVGASSLPQRRRA